MYKVYSNMDLWPFGPPDPCRPCQMTTQNDYGSNHLHLSEFVFMYQFSLVQNIF